MYSDEFDSYGNIPYREEDNTRVYNRSVKDLDASLVLSLLVLPGYSHKWMYHKDPWKWLVHQIIYTVFSWDVLSNGYTLIKSRVVLMITVQQHLCYSIQLQRNTALKAQCYTYWIVAALTHLALFCTSPPLSAVFLKVGQLSSLDEVLWCLLYNMVPLL